jgi:fucose 4-O-acetylase-like acetyltransferase
LETLTVAKIPNSTFAWMRSWQWIHVSFFMPAFFIITGLCSNIEKEFKPFFISNVRTILIPAIVFDLLFFTIPSLFMGQDPWKFVMGGFVMRALGFGGVYWFLPCLFLSKLIYWTLHKYTNKLILLDYSNSIGCSWIYTALFQTLSTKMVVFEPSFRSDHIFRNRTIFE